MEGTAGQPILLSDGLQAGFLASTRGTHKYFVGFKKTDNCQIIRARDCTKEERRLLSKLVYGLKIVRSLQGLSDQGNEVCLFTYK
jgi:hypothetical protein